MESLFQAVRFPAFVVLATLVAIAFPLYVVIAIATLVGRLLWTPKILVGSAMRGDSYRLQRYNAETANFPWWGDYAIFWRGLMNWQKTGSSGQDGKWRF